MFHVEPANVNERNVLDTKKEKLIDRGTHCIVADNGYVDKKRAAAFAESAVLLLTPKTTLEEANALLGQTRSIQRHKSQLTEGHEKLRLNLSLIC